MPTEEHVPTYVREHGSLETPVRLVHLNEALTGLRQEPAWLRGERVAQTLVKDGHLRSVLTLLPAGTELPAHHAAGPATVHCLQGRMRLTTQPAPPLELAAGDWVALDTDVEHSVKAVTECACLVTLAL